MNPDPKALTLPTAEQIGDRAFEMWLAKGRPHGRALELYQAAEQQLNAEMHKSVALLLQQNAEPQATPACAGALEPAALSTSTSRTTAPEILQS